MMKPRRSGLDIDVIRQATTRLTSHTFDYHRVGHDHRLMTFLPDGRIGSGARSGEVFWRLRKKASQALLEICSEKNVTCRLEEKPDKIWRGKWLQFERMRIELVPVGKLSVTLPISKKPPAKLGPLPESVFIVSLPRSLSTIVHDQVCHAVGLGSPAWTSAGEIVNLDRFALCSAPANDANRKFISKAADTAAFYATADFLDQVVQPFGFAYKDVVQPFIVAAWLKQRNFRTLRIKRNIADVAYSMLERGWTYPAQLLPKSADRERALVRGLALADKELDSISGEHIDFDELISDESVLQRALANLYSNRPVGRVRFMDENFKAMRSEILDRRKTRRHKKLHEYARINFFAVNGHK